MKILIICAFIVLGAIEPAVTFRMNEFDFRSATIAKTLYGIADGSFKEVKIFTQHNCYFGKEIVTEFSKLNDENAEPMVLLQNSRFFSAQVEILLFCSAEEFVKYQRGIEKGNIRQTQKALIFCKGLNMDLLSKFIDHISNDQDFYLIENAENIQIIKFTKYSEATCKSSLSIINSFNTNTKKWIFKNKKAMFMSQNDFNGCPIFFKMDERSMVLPPYMTSGLNQEILMALERKYNFNAKSKIIANNEYHADDSMIDATLAVKTIKMLRTYEVSFPLENIKRFFLVSDNRRKFVNSEKIFLAFDQDTWILIIISIILPIFSIQIINRLDKSAQNLIYGGKVSSPTLNVLAIIFGVRQTAQSRFLPKRCSSRVIFILFVFYSLIIRTCYQKLSFEFLTRDIYGNDLYSIHDLIQNNYKFVIPNFGSQVYDIPNVIIVKPDTFIDIITKECIKENSKFVLIIDSLLEVQIKHLLRFCRWIRLHVSVDDALVLSVPQNHELSDLIVPVISDLAGSGILNLRIKNFLYQAEYFNHFLHYPKVLSLNDLNFYFEIWLVALSFPITVFIFEVVIFKCRNQSRIRAKYQEQDSFECIDLPINTDETQANQNIPDPEQEEDKSADQSEAEEENQIPVEENENSNEVCQENLQTTDDIIPCDEKEVILTQTKTDADESFKENDTLKAVENLIDVSNYKI